MTPVQEANGNNLVNLFRSSKGMLSVLISTHNMCVLVSTHNIQFHHKIRKFP